MGSEQDIFDAWLAGWRSGDSSACPDEMPEVARCAWQSAVELRRSFETAEPADRWARAGIRIVEGRGQVLAVEEGSGRCWSAATGSAWASADVSGPPWRERGMVSDLPADLLALVGDGSDAETITLRGRDLEVVRLKAPARTELWESDTRLLFWPGAVDREVVLLAAGAYLDGVERGVALGRSDKALELRRALQME